MRRLTFTWMLVRGQLQPVALGTSLLEVVLFPPYRHPQQLRNVTRTLTLTSTALRCRGRDGNGMMDQLNALLEKKEFSAAIQIIETAELKVKRADLVSCSLARSLSPTNCLVAL